MPKHAAIRAPKPIKPRQRHRAPNRALSPGSIVNLRNEIRVKNLIHRLQDFALDDPDEPKAIRMSRTQAMVALSLLKKCLPDMQTLEISGNQDQPIKVEILRFSDPVADSMSDLHPMQHAQQPALTSRAVGLDEPLTIDITPRLIEDEPKPKRRTRSR